MEDILTRPRALRALILLRQADPEPMTAGTFQQAIGYAVEAAAELRKDLASWGLVAVEEGYRGKIPFVHMRLTSEGRTLADMTMKLETLALAARDKHRRRK